MVQMEYAHWKTNGAQTYLHVVSKNTELTEAGTERQLLRTRNREKCRNVDQIVKKCTSEDCKHFRNLVYTAS